MYILVKQWIRKKVARILHFWWRLYLFPVVIYNEATDHHICSFVDPKGANTCKAVLSHLSLLFERNLEVSQLYDDPRGNSITDRNPKFPTQNLACQQKKATRRAPLQGTTGPPQTIPTNIDVIVRAILACIIALCIPYALFVYMQTKEAAVLGLATILGVAVGLVYTYYFPGRRRK